MADILGLGPARHWVGPWGGPWVGPWVGPWAGRRSGFDESAERGRISRHRAQGQNAGALQFPRRFQGETLSVRMENTDTELFMDLDTPSDG